MNRFLPILFVLGLFCLLPAIEAKCTSKPPKNHDAKWWDTPRKICRAEAVHVYDIVCHEPEPGPGADASNNGSCLHLEYDLPRSASALVPG
ncbi:unnamed protein product, partial [Mesorhabditis spiculigera]